MKIINSYRFSQSSKLALIFLLGICISCKKKMTQDEVYRIGKDKCAKMPTFVNKIGFKANRSVYATLLKNVNGIALVELPMVTTDTANFKIYQHDTWKKFGAMGSLTTGADGSEYTVPVPLINTLDRPLSQMNRIYRIEPENGSMDVFCVLPKADTTSGVVPFGVLGVFFDCHSNKIFASSVAGSTRDNENGIIYSINPKDGKVEDELKGYDAIGLFVCGISGTKMLYFGSARNSKIYGIELDKEGKFVGEPTELFTLNRLGPRGDDKARKIKMDQNGNLIVYGTEFNFNLVANTKIPESVYQFDYIAGDNKWIFNNFK